MIIFRSPARSAILTTVTLAVAMSFLLLVGAANSKPLVPEILRAQSNPDNSNCVKANNNDLLDICVNANPSGNDNDTAEAQTDNNSETQLVLSTCLIVNGSSAGCTGYHQVAGDTPQTFNNGKDLAPGTWCARTFEQGNSGDTQIAQTCLSGEPN